MASSVHTSHDPAFPEPPAQNAGSDSMLKLPHLLNISIRFPVVPDRRPARSNDGQNPPSKRRILPQPPTRKGMAAEHGGSGPPCTLHRTIRADESVQPGRIVILAYQHIGVQNFPAVRLRGPSKINGFGSKDLARFAKGDTVKISCGVLVHGVHCRCRCRFCVRPFSAVVVIE